MNCPTRVAGFLFGLFLFVPLPGTRAAGPSRDEALEARRASAIQLRERIDALQQPEPAVAFHPLYVPRENVNFDLVPPETALEARELPRRWPPEAYREDPDRLRRQAESFPAAEELTRQIDIALAARGSFAVAAGSGSLPGSNGLAVRMQAELFGQPDSDGATEGVGPDAWTPVFYGASTSSGIHTAGRLNQIARAYDPAQGLVTSWAASVNGGLYKVAVVFPFAFWVPVSYTLPGPASVGSFLVRPSDGAQILVGTGEIFRSPGNGIYKSVNGGATWTKRPLPSGDTESVFKLRAGATNDGVVLAATTTGLFRSTDFGDSWTNVYGTGWITDVLQDPAYPDFWYAAVFGLGVLESSDNGLSFHPFAGACTGIPGPLERVELAVSPAAANFVFALVSKLGGLMNGIYRSSDYGCHWTAIETVDYISWGQSFHTGAITVDPATPDRLFVGFAGNQWTANATAPSPCWRRMQEVDNDCGLTNIFSAVHADQTDMLLFGDDLWMANDGGLYVYDTGTHVSDDLGNDLGFVTFQLMGSTQMLAGTRLDPERLYVGLQDNGVLRIDGSAAMTVLGGDGGAMSNSPDNLDLTVGGVGMAYFRVGTWDGGDEWGSLNCGLADRGYSQVFADPTPGRPMASRYLFTIAPDVANGEYVWFKDTEFNCAWQKVHTTPLPFVPSAVDMNNDPSRYTIYVWGGGDRRVAVMDTGTLGSRTWALRTPPGIDLPLSGPGADVRLFAEHSGLRPGRAYYTSGEALPRRAFLTENRGLNWREVTGNLALVSGGSVLLEMAGDPRGTNVLFASTATGVFRTDTGHLAYPYWYRYMEGLPAVTQALNLEVFAETGGPFLVRVGTYGHGVWERTIAPTDSLFADGLEAGSTIAWSAAAP